MDIAAIQRMAFALVKALSGFDAQRIVQEKQEDGEALEAVGLAIAAVGAKVKSTAADGIVEVAELQEIRAAIDDAKNKLEALGIEIIDQQMDAAP